MPTVKGYLEIEDGTQIDFQFNPNELSVSHSNQWQSEAVPGRPVPELKFSGAGSGTISVNLEIDTTPTGEAVTTQTRKLEQCMHIDTSRPGYDEAKSNGRPPWVQMHWGPETYFKSVITSLSINYTYFNGDGTPLRAKVSLSLQQFEPDDNFPRQNPTSGTPLPHRTHMVQPGETLDRIAAKHYGDSTKWRALATANGIEDPLALKPGRILDVPKLGA